ncbi:4947_t:CDS:2, partial [Ambispora gerdemannii]
FFTGPLVKAKDTLRLEDGCSRVPSTILSSSSLDKELENFNFSDVQIQKKITIPTIITTDVTKHGRHHEKDRSKFHHQYTPYFEDWNGVFFDTINTEEEEIQLNLVWEEKSLYRLETTKLLSLSSLSSYDRFFLDVAFSHNLGEVDDDDSDFNDDFLVLDSPFFHPLMDNIY